MSGRIELGAGGRDPGLTLGLSVFETFRSYGARVFRLGAHLERLRAGAATMGIAVPDGLERTVLAAVLPNHRFRITLTAGGHASVDRVPIDPSRAGRPVRVGRLECVPGPLSGVKHGSRAEWELAARFQAVDEVLLICAGRVLEASRSNVLAVTKGVLRAPVEDALPGITRAALVECAGALGLPVDEGPLLEWEPVDELYVSSSLKELAPIVERSGSVAPGWGPVGRRLATALRERIAAEAG